MKKLNYLKIRMPILLVIYLIISCSTLILVGFILSACGSESPTSPQVETVDPNTIRGTNWEVTVDSCWYANRLNSRQGYYTPAEGWIFLVVHLTVKNLQTEAGTFYSDWVVVIGSDGKSYKVEGIGNGDDDYDLGLSWSVGNVRPEASTTIRFVFVVPSEEKHFKLKFLDYDPIDLNP